MRRGYTFGLTCPHCGQRVERGWKLMSNEVQGTYTTAGEASGHAVMPDNVTDTDCDHCGTTFFVALIDRRW